MIDDTQSVIDDVIEEAGDLPARVHATKWRFELDRLLSNADFRQRSQDVANFLHQKLIGGDEATRKVADLLHGKFLGHPLHPLLTDVTIGSWLLGFFYDVVGLIPGTGHLRKVADQLTFLGLITALPTALAGMTDYASIKQDAAQYGAAHGLLNGVAFFCYTR
jgi:hypothetical protein